MDKQQMLKNFYLKTSSPLFKRTLSECEQVAASNVNVLILGEPGTGKETIARYIHACSPRALSPFISVNCQAYSGEGLQDELFGHELNSLTGPQNIRPGKLSTVGDGTLPANCEEAAQSLEEGQWSGILEADDGFYLILRKPVDLEAVAPDYFDALLQAAADSAEVSVSKAYERLSARQFYDALTAGRSALENPSSEQTADS